MSNKFANRFGFLRDSKSLGYIDTWADSISSMHILGLEAKKRPPRLQFSAWVTAKDQKAIGPRLYLRIWGSPESLPEDAEGLLVGLKAELVAHEPGLSVEHKKAVAYALADQTISSPEIKNKASHFIYRGKDVPDLAVIFSEATKEIGVPRMLENERIASLSPKPDLVFESRLRADAKIVEKFYSAEAKMRLKKVFGSIPSVQVKKPEFQLVIARKGRVDLKTLRSAYSLLMALVLMYPGRRLRFYHTMRMRYHPHYPTEQATVQELTDLIKLRYVERALGRYYPPEYFH